MENQAQETTQTQTELSLADLQNVKTVLDAAVRRGAFAANEMSSVGAVYDKLNNFLNAVAAQQPAEETKPAE